MGKKAIGGVIEPSKEINALLSERGMRIVAPNRMRRSGLPRLGTQREMEPFTGSPKEGEYLEVISRATSRAVIENGIIAMDFTADGALERSAPFYKPQGLRRVPNLSEHDWSLGSTIGFVGDSWYSRGDLGLDKEGVNVVRYIYVNAAPRTVELIEKRVYDSVSVSDEWDFELSHPDMDLDEFFARQGELVEGRVVSFVVGDYKAVFEVSDVAIPADKNARNISFRRVSWAEIESRFARPLTPDGRIDGAPDDGRKLIAVSGLRARTDNDGTRGAGKKEAAMSTISLAKLSAFFDGDFDDEDAVADFARKQSTALEKLKVERDKAQKEADALRPRAEAGDEYIKSLREAVKKQAAIVAEANDGKISEEEDKAIAEAGFEELKRMQAVYGVRMTNELKVRCAKCREEITVGDALSRSSKPSPIPGEEAEDERIELPGRTADQGKKKLFS